VASRSSNFNLPVLPAVRSARTAARTVPATPPPPRRRRRKGWWLPYALIVPALLLELLIHILPMLFGIWTSLIHLSQLTIRNWTTAPFVGLQNYRTGLSFSNPIGHEFFASLLRTVWYTVLVVGISWAFGMAAAVCCNSTFRGRSFFRTLFLGPYALPVLRQLARELELRPGGGAERPAANRADDRVGRLPTRRAAEGGEGQCLRQSASGGSGGSR